MQRQMRGAESCSRGIVTRTNHSRSGVARMSTFIESGIPFEGDSWLAS